MQVDSQFELSSAELRKVDRVRFGILSPDEIKAMSVCEIQTPFTYDNAVPKDGGLLDLRMGTMERFLRCKSCNGDMKSCPGHFGHIELVKPCLHIGLMPIIAKILKCVCFSCSSLLLSPDNPKYHHTMRIKKPAKRLHAMLKLCQGMKRCNGGFDVDAAALADDNERERNGDRMDDHDEVRKPKSSGCGNILPRYKVESGYEVLIEFPEDSDAMLEGSVDRKKPLSASRIHEIFKRISDDDVRALGFDPQYARPDWFVLTVLAVPPPPVRPSVMFNSSARSSDDLTYKLADIVKANQALRTQELQGAAEHILLDYTRLLQWHVATLMDNEISGQPQSFQRSGKPIKSIRQRIVGKGGRVRGNLMGKRVDFSARSVITPDPNLGIDQLGVPRTIALNMTYPEIVTRFNIGRMRELVKNGPNIHPGAKTIIRDDGRVIDLRYIKKTSDLHLEIGYKVERHIVDGDPVIFNRQPSLHKMSMMGHKVRVFPWSTFRLNLSCTTPYNADFDGDEMNMHVPQSYGTRAEVLNIILSPRQVVSPQANKPVMGIVQDTLLGVMKFTFRDNFITRDLTYNILMNLETWDGRLPVPAILKPQPMWTGKQLFSCLLPKINMAHTSNNHPDNEEGIMSVSDTLVLVEMGELIQGTIDKRTVGNAQNSLIHLIWVEYGPFRCAQFFTEVQKMVNHWLINHGFSIGIGDAVATSSVLAEIESTIGSAKTEVSNIINRARAGKLERTPGRTINETFEGEVNGVLNKATDQCGKLVKKALLHTNNVNAMVSAGSKGNAINICQIIACVGQQNVSGKRIPFGFRNRSLPHFNKYDLGPESKGFVENCFPLDHEILTERGFLGRDAVLACLESSPLRIACFNAETRSLEYHAIGVKDVRQPRGDSHAVVRFDSRRTDGLSNHVSVVATRSHDMYARRGAEAASDIEWEKNPFQKHSAGELVAPKDKDSRAFTHIKMLAHAANGLGTDVAESIPWAGALGLTTPDQLAAFVELFGYWISAGSLNASSALEPRASIGFALTAASDEAYLPSLFARLPLCGAGELSSSRCDDAEGRRAFHLFKARWVEVFEAEFGSKRQQGAECLPAWVWSMGKSLTRRLIAGLQSADGSEDSERGMIFTSAIGLRDNLVHLCLHAGYASYYERTLKAGEQNAAVDRWCVFFADAEFSVEPTLQVDGDISESVVSGPVWCVTVPQRDQLIFVRRVLTVEDGVTVEASKPVISGNSYLKGLTPQEFFFHAMGGREGLVDTAVKTAETGYIQRRLVKCMEDVMVQYDASVRNALGEIIQFVYGEDGMDGCFIEKQKLDSAKMDDDKLRSVYGIDLSHPESLDSWLALDVKEKLLRDPEAHAKLQSEFDGIMEDRDMLRARVLKIGDDGCYLPVNMKRLIWNAQKRFRTTPTLMAAGGLTSRSTLSPLHVIDSLQNLCSRLVVIRGGDSLSREAQSNATLLFKTMLRSTFASKRVIKDYNLSKDAFNWLLGEVEARFNQALAHPGEMIGSIAAQSIGEPATQMTLNTFHYAGVSSKNVTLGVPRLREIIDVAASCKTPSLTVYLKDQYAHDADAAKSVLNKLEFTTLKSVTERTEIYYDPTPEQTCVEEDREFMSFYFEIPDDDFSMDSASPWMLRIVLDRKKKESKELTNNDIAEHINNEWKGDLKCIFSNDNAPKLVLQIRFKNDDDKDAASAEDGSDDDVFLKKVEESLLNTMELRGIKGITKVFLRQEKMAKYTDRGRYQKDEDVWVLDTEGVALLRVMCVDEVDHRQTNSNVVTEMFDVLGIEAARASLLKELRAVIEFDGAYVNYRHLAMLCDTMTFRGHLMSINRHGINRADSGALMRCSFEETVEILVQAAAFSELDTLRGVSENVMLGNLPPLGTNSFKLFLNQPMLERYAIDEPDHAKLFSSMYSLEGAADGLVMAPGTPMQNFGGAMTPSGAFSPSGGAFSPATGQFSPSMPYSPSSPGAANFSPTSPSYSPTSPNASYSPTSPNASYSPTSPSYSPTSPNASYSPTSPSYSPTSPAFSNTSPSYSPTSPSYSPTSPGGGASYSPTSPSYSPTSPGGRGGASYSPTSPSYSPTSPGGAGASYSPTSPSYSPTSPQAGGASYSPTSPSYSPTSPGAGGAYSPTSPSYSPTSPTHNYSPTSPSYSPTSPSYHPDTKDEHKRR